MIRCSPMVSIRQPLNTGNGSTKEIAFIQRVYGQDPHIHEVWILGLDRIIHEIHPIARVEVIARSVEEFVTNYLAENGHIIHIIGHFSINGSVPFLGVPVQA